jgi:hypothetical protein
MTFKEFLLLEKNNIDIENRNIIKKKWELILTHHDKELFSDELLNLTKTAYKNTTLGSFIKTIDDVFPSNWIVIDYDEDPQLDVCIFYRKANLNDNWTGNKVQGIGHDGQKDSKRLAIDKLIEFLSRKGNWIECSEKLQEILISKNSSLLVNDEELLKKLFKSDNLKMINNTTYTRELPDGAVIQESVIGKPKLKEY